jgi:hypothetical protein
MCYQLQSEQFQLQLQLSSFFSLRVVCVAFDWGKYCILRLIRQRGFKQVGKFFKNSRNRTQGEAEQCNQPEAVDAAICLPGLNRGPGYCKRYLGWRLRRW